MGRFEVESPRLERAANKVSIPHLSAVIHQRGLRTAIRRNNQQFRRPQTGVASALEQGVHQPKSKGVRPWRTRARPLKPQSGRANSSRCCVRTELGSNQRCMSTWWSSIRASRSRRCGRCNDGCWLVAWSGVRHSPYRALDRPSLWSATQPQS